MHNLDLLIISHYPMRSGCRENSIHLSHVCFNLHTEMDETKEADSLGVKYQLSQ